MWKLLPVCLLVSCAVNDQQQPAGGGNQPEQFRIVRQVELPVESSADITSPHISPVGADIAPQICFHKGFSDQAEYQCVFPREENSLWEQRSSEIVSIW
jgi:hypothetical protein